MSLKSRSRWLEQTMPGSARYMPPSPPSCISLLAFCDRVHTALVPAWLPPRAPDERQHDEERGEPSMPVHRSLRVACHQARQRTARLSSGHCSARCRPARSPTSILSLPPDRGASRALTCRRLLALPPATPSVPPVCETVCLPATAPFRPYPAGVARWHLSPRG
jgi:hypothetical protein